MLIVQTSGPVTEGWESINREKGLPLLLLIYSVKSSQTGKFFWIHHWSVVIDLKILGKWHSLKHKVEVRDKDFQGARHAVAKKYIKELQNQGTMGPMKKFQRAQ